MVIKLLTFTITLNGKLLSFSPSWKRRPEAHAGMSSSLPIKWFHVGQGLTATLMAANVYRLFWWKCIIYLCMCVHYLWVWYVVFINSIYNIYILNIRFCDFLFADRRGKSVIFKCAVIMCVHNSQHSYCFQ